MKVLAIYTWWWVHRSIDRRVRAGGSKSEPEKRQQLKANIQQSNDIYFKQNRSTWSALNDGVHSSCAYFMKVYNMRLKP